MERTVCSGEARDEVTERVGHRLEERLRNADRQGGAERVAEPGRILDGEPTFLTGDTHPDRAALFLQRSEHLSRRAAKQRFVGIEVAEQSQYVSHVLGVTGAPLL